MTCKEICNQYGIKGGGRYSRGDKHCSECEGFFRGLLESVVNCPCCHCRLSNRPKNQRWKEKLRVKLGKAEVQIV